MKKVLLFFGFFSALFLFSANVSFAYHCPGVQIPDNPNIACPGEISGPQQPTQPTCGVPPLPPCALDESAFFENSGSGSGGATALPNPIGINDPRDIVGNIIQAILGIVGSLALAVFIFGGFTWVISAGNPEKIQKGKDMMFWASLGLAVIFFSYALVLFVIQAVSGQSVTGGAGSGTLPAGSGTLPNGGGKPGGSGELPK